MPKLKIEKIEQITPKIKAFTLVAMGNDQLQPYSAGAHIDVELGDKGVRSYSLIDWQVHENALSFYQIAVQCEEEGQGGSKAMHALNEGDELATSEPSNDFEMVQSDKPVLLLAGGIGITPIISMATALKAKSHPFSLHYCGRSRDIMGFVDEIEAEFGDLAHLHFDDCLPLDIPALMEQVKDHKVYICGPRGMIEKAREAAISAGVDHDDIHLELFTAAAPQENDGSFEVEIHETGQVFTIPADKSIIEVLEENGIDVTYDCQRGDCGICQCDVIEGVPDHRDVVLSDSEKAEGKVMQICVSRAKSARLVLDIL